MNAIQQNLSNEIKSNYNKIISLYNELHNDPEKMYKLFEDHPIFFSCLAMAFYETDGQSYLSYNKPLPIFTSSDVAVTTISHFNLFAYQLINLKIDLSATGDNRAEYKRATSFYNNYIRKELNSLNNLLNAFTYDTTMYPTRTETVIYADKLISNTLFDYYVLTPIYEGVYTKGYFEKLYKKTFLKLNLKKV